MSTSETITRTDLTNILNEILPPVTLNPWASMYIEGISVNNTATKVTGLTMNSGGNASDYFDIGTSNEIKIKKAGKYKITIYFRTTAITSAGNVKRISCYVNGSESAVAMARLNTWEDTMSITFRDLNANDVLTMYKRAEDGGSTYGAARILVEALTATTGTPTAEADYIVEQGTSGIWTYRKWNSGIAECWGDTGVITITNYATYNNMYAYMTSVTLPQGLFINAPIFTYSAYVDNGFALTGTVNTGSHTTTALALYALCSATGSKPTRWLVDAKGRWK